MICLIFSDSHGSPYYIAKVLKKHPDAEVVFFLGDGLADVDSIASCDSSRMWIAVRGNCDFRSIFCGREAIKTEEIVLLGKRIIATHGDLYQVKWGLEDIKSLARSRKADIVLFGHTHIPYEKYVSEGDGFYLFNPGSISAPGYSYGLLTLTEKGILLSHGSI